MSYLLYGVLGVISVILTIIVTVVYGLIQKQINCPKCGIPLPKIRKPKNIVQAFQGGWTCPNCKSEINRKGNLTQNTDELINIKRNIKKKIIIFIIGFVILSGLIVGSVSLYTDFIFHPYKYSKNVEFCNKIPGYTYSFRETCFYQMAIKNDNVSLCLKSNILDLNDCYDHFIEKASDVSFCDKLPNTPKKSDCFLKFALQNNDVNLCNNVALRDKWKCLEHFEE
jgi:hypothetical protein